MAETRYNPARTEAECYQLWEEQGCFRARPRSKRKRYSIVIPPPNVTGALHMGHALNMTIQDILVRLRRMQGFDSVWFPGKDHAGIATQNVVERDLVAQGTTREEIGREGFLKRCWEWVDQYGGRIGAQIRRLGASCDWERERFTFDEGLSRAVSEVFVRLHDKGLIYRGWRIINWCPRCRTALSDEESPKHDLEGKLFWIRYPLKGSDESIQVATTRPETMLGDTAVAVHPDDERYREWVGKTAILPVLNREIPVVADEAVESDFGSGAVKVTPAHDPADFEIGLRHDLGQIRVIDDGGLMTSEAGPYVGRDRFACRAALLEDLKAHGFYIREEEHLHAVPHCHRCHTVVEPTLSQQWFVKMEPLGRPALEAVRDGKVRFVPERYSRTYFDWLEKFRDWCISRQLWWGHRIPAYHCASCKEYVVALESPETCPHCGEGPLEQDPDVLDTWFSSALWPFSIMGWPEKSQDLRTYYPTDVLVTARDIIYFWVARMVIQGLEFMDEIPFHTVLIHGTILDEDGVIMSKSRGNGIDPIEMIDKFGADAVRFSLIQLTSEGQDIRLSESRFDSGKRFANKIWNASRFVLDQIGGRSIRRPKRKLKEEDRWILSRLHSVIDRVTGSMEEFRLHDSAHILYQFFWHEFCDWYLEIVKPRLKEGTETERDGVRWILGHVLDTTLRLLHPFIPFVTEDIWQKLKGSLPKRGRGEVLATAKYPVADRKKMDGVIESRMERVFEIIKGIRNVRKEVGIPRAEPLKISATVPDEAVREEIEAGEELLRRMAVLKESEVAVGLPRPEKAISKMIDGIQIHVHVEGLEARVDAWRARQEAERKKLEDQLRAAEKKLANPNFLEKAPPEVVDRLREHRDRLLRAMEMGSG